MKNIYLLFFIIGCVFLFNIWRTPDKKINAKVLFINQIRGEECCQKGSYEFTKKQLDLFSFYSFPATFVLRYDALNNNKFVSLLKTYSKSNFDYGLFLEITPLLAKNAGVEYKGTEDRWYRAQYAYLVGYSQEERKKLIDVAMNLFKMQFGHYPKTTGGWMIDTYSAEYLAKTYGVENHEITREQYGTDGYALYGGSITSVYTPSNNWVFMPAQTASEALPLRIIRQTLSDPVRNYGDLTSGYTSQPNDYGRTKNLDYFKHLISQVENYSQPIAVLGLENSLDKNYQNTYEQQVGYISQVIARKNIILPKDITQINNSNFITGSDFYDKLYKTYWIETSKYRARIIQKDTYIQLTDLRVFGASMRDPYYASASGEKTAYWEIPYIFDSSKKGIHKEINNTSIKIGELFRIFGNEDWMRERTNPVVNEQFLREINGIIFPPIKKDTNPIIAEKDGIITLHYIKANGNEITFLFNEDRFFVKGISKKEYELKGAMGENTQLLQEQKDDTVVFTPLSVVKSTIGEVNIQKTETVVDAQRAEISLIYNASLSLIGRNPARIVVVSKDSGGNPARIKSMQITHTKGNFDSVKIHETEGHLGEFDGMYYVDIEQKTPGIYTPILTLDSQKLVLQPLSFVYDCKKNIKSCLVDPQKLINYVRVKVGDLINRR